MSQFHPDWTIRERPIAGIHEIGQLLGMALRRIARAAGVSVICLLISFLLINLIMIAWYAQTDPHDGQAGIAAFVWGLVVAPVCAILAFIYCVRR